jgi:hypothetical protein
MAAPQSVFTTTAPPEYSEKDEGQAPTQQPAQPGGQLQYPQGQYPGALPQTWPQGYPVSH